MHTFRYSLASEWLKRKRSASTWLVIVGALFIPITILLALLFRRETLPERVMRSNYWEHLIFKNWETMAMFLLPMGIVLLTSLLAQLEYKNNTWKMVHALPQRFSAVFFSKLTIIILLLLFFFLLFSVGIYLEGIFPSLVFPEVPFPAQPYPLSMVLDSTFNFFLACLPIVAIQFGLSLHYRNFMVPVGTGMVLVIAALFLLPTKNGYLMPYTHCARYYLDMTGEARPGFDLKIISVIYFVVITAIVYYIYINKKEKG